MRASQGLVTVIVFHFGAGLGCPGPVLELLWRLAQAWPGTTCTRPPPHYWGIGDLLSFIGSFSPETLVQSQKTETEVCSLRDVEAACCGICSLLQRELRQACTSGASLVLVPHSSSAQHLSTRPHLPTGPQHPNIAPLARKQLFKPRACRGPLQILNKDSIVLSGRSAGNFFGP